MRTDLLVCGVLVGALGAWAPIRPAAAQQPLNLDFERIGVEGPPRPWGWTTSALVPGAVTGVDSLVRRSGRLSLRITLPTGNEGAHTMQYWVSPYSARGRRVRVAGWLRSDAGGGNASMSLMAIGPAGVLDADSTVIPISGTTRWTMTDLSIGVDSSAYSLVLTVGARGAGTVWFDDLRLELAGRQRTEVSVGRAPTDSERAWLDRWSSPLLRVDAARPAEVAEPGDLEALGAIVGGATVVALGESTHGTSEFFRLKHRVTEFLVREHGFRVFAIEANQLAVEYINAYVHGAADDVRRVVGLMFAVWNTEEMVALVEWMRVYNAEHPDRTVEFVGYDMQDPSLPIDSVRASLRRRDPELELVADRLYRGYREAWRTTAYPQAPDSARRQWLDGAEAVWRQVADRRTPWLRAATTAADTTEVEWLIQNANVVRQAARSAWSGDLPDRDRAMAENVHWILQQRPPGTRMVLWAHNSHVGRGHDPHSGFFLGRSMGVQLAQMYGDDLRVFGLLTYVGEYSGTAGFASRRMITAPAYPAPIGSVAEALHRIARVRAGVGLITDLRSARDDADGRWLHEARPMRFVGYAAVDFGFEAVIAAADVFDAILFVDRTSASRGLR